MCSLQLPSSSLIYPNREVYLTAVIGISFQQTVLELLLLLQYSLFPN